MAKVTLKNLKKNREYFISKANKSFSGDSGTYTTELRRCENYRVTTAKCADVILSIPPGRYRRILVVSSSLSFFFSPQGFFLMQ